MYTLREKDSKNNENTAWFESGTALGFWNPNTDKWVLSCSGKNPYTGYWKTYYKGTFALPDEFTGKIMKVGWIRPSRQKPAVFGSLSVSTKDSPSELPKKEKETTHWICAGEKSMERDLISIVPDPSVPSGQLLLIGAYTLGKGIFAIWSSATDLYNSPLLTVKDLSPTPRLIVPASSVSNLQACDPLVPEIYKVIIDSFQLDANQKFLNTELSSLHTPVPGTNLTPWGWFPMNKNKLEDKIQLWIGNNTSSEVPSKNKTKRIPVEFTSLPKFWNGEGKIEIDDTIPGSRALLRMDNKKFFLGIVNEVKQTIPAVDFKKASNPGFSKVNPGEFANGVFLYAQKLYVCWSFVKRLSSCTFGRDSFILPCLNQDFFPSWPESNTGNSRWH